MSLKHSSRPYLYKGTRIGSSVTEAAVDALENFEIRDDDVIVTSYPKSGTHLILEVVLLILADGDANKLDYARRDGYLEGTNVKDLSRIHTKKPISERLKTCPSPRVLQSHFRTYLIPKGVWTKKIPIVYVLRDPKDVFLSFYEMQKTHVLSENRDVDLDEFFEEFISGNVPYDGWCEHVTSYENLNGKENILFVTYEETKKDPRAVIESIAKHIGHDINEDVVEKVAANITFEAMKRNYDKAMDALKEDDPNPDVIPLSLFINKGIAGRWKTEYFEDKWRRLDEKFKAEVKDTVYAKTYFE